VGDRQSCVQTQFLERKRVSQRCGARLFDQWRDSRQRDKKEEHARRKVLRATYLCAARIVPALSDRMSAERFDVLG